MRKTHGSATEMEHKFSELREIDKAQKHALKFKDHISHMSLAGAIIASWSLTQEVAGSNYFAEMTNIFGH